MCYVILCVSVTFDIYVSVMIFVCDNLCCYGNMCYCDTVMICVSVMHYACDNYPINPTLDSWPKMAEYGEHFIPEWWAEFFWNWTNLIPIGQLLVVLSAIQAINMSFMSPLACSTDPWPCRCLGLPWTNFNSGQISFNSVIIWAVNSEPLSQCRMEGAPNV